MLLPLLLRMRLSHPRYTGINPRQISAIYLAAFERAASARLRTGKPLGLMLRKLDLLSSTELKMTIKPL